MPDVKSDVIRQLSAGVVVELTRDETSKTYWYSAWEPAKDLGYGELRKLEGQRYGRVDTRSYPEALPEDDGDRSHALVSWELTQRERAYLLIRRAFPEAQEGYRSKGRVHFVGDPAATLERLKRKGKLPSDSQTETAPTFAGSVSERSSGK